MTVSKSRSDRPRRRSVWVAAAVGGLIGALISLLVAEPVRRALFDEWQVLAPRRIDADKVAVVMIDRESLAAVGPWPWPRYYLARLTEAIAADRPKVIGFDMIFAEEDRLNPQRFAALYPELEAQTAARLQALPSMDSIFAHVLSRSPVVLGRLGIDGGGSDPAALFVDPEVAGRPPYRTARFRHALSSITELDDVALGHAMLNGPPDADGIVRRVPLAVLTGDRPMPGMAVELARIAADAPALKWQGPTLLVGPHRLPADDAGQLELHFGVVPAAARHSAARVLAGATPDQEFRNKVVLVGLAAEGIADIVATPLATEGYGVLVQAQAVDAMLNGGWLTRPRWLVAGEWALGGLLALLVAFAGTARRRWPLVLAAGAIASLPLVSWLAFDTARMLFDPLRPALIGGWSAIAAGALVVMRGRAERMRLERALVEQRITSAVREGELQAARTIQLGMVPTHESLARLDRRFCASGMLDPAHSVGGDFYDAVRLDADHLLFMIGDVTGKGVPAALYMALSKTLAKSVLVRERGGLAHAVGTLNRELMRDADDAMGVTMLVILADCATGELTMVNAGHENPILLRPRTPPRTVPMDGGPPLCVCDFPYPEERMTLAAEDVLVLITDGVTEAHDEQGRIFGSRNVLSTLAKREGESLDGIVRGLAEAIRRFEFPSDPTDDLTIFALGYRGATD